MLTSPVTSEEPLLFRLVGRGRQGMAGNLLGMPGVYQCVA